jgi:tetratricopeptide (TPR) repeat protein
MTQLDLIFFTMMLVILAIAFVFVRIIERDQESHQRSLEFRKYRRYLESLDRILQADPTCMKAYRYKGQIFEAMGLLDEANRNYRIANVITPRIVDTEDYVEPAPLHRQAALAAAGASDFSSTK